MGEEIAVMEYIREPSNSDVLGTKECRSEDAETAESDAGKVDVDNVDIESQKEMSIDLVEEVDCPGIQDESSHEPAPSTELIPLRPSENDEYEEIEGVINANAKESDGEMSTELILDEISSADKLQLEDINANETPPILESLLGPSSPSTATAESIIPKDGQINMQNSKGETPLILAAKNGHLETILLLLSCGANVEMSDDEGNSALMHATIGNHTSCITALLNHGSSMTHTNNHELSPFRLAMSGGHSEAQKAMAQFLQESGFCEYVKRSTLQNSRSSMRSVKATLGKKPQCQDLKRVQKIIGIAKKRVNGYASDKVMTRKSNNSNEEMTSSISTDDKIESEETKQNVELSPKKQLGKVVPPKESQIQSVISEVRKDSKRPLKVPRHPYPRQRPRQAFQPPWQPRGPQDFHRFRAFPGCNLGLIKTQKPGPGLMYQSRPLLSPPGYINQGFPMNFNRSAPGYNNLGFPGPQNFPPNNSVSIHPSFPLPLHRNFTPRW